MPGHLDRFEDFLVRFLGIILKVWERRDPGVHVGESNGEWVGFRMFSEAEWKVLFRLPRLDDRKFVAEEMGGGDDLLKPLQPRQFWLFNDEWDRARFYPYITTNRRVK